MRNLVFPLTASLFFAAEPAAQNEPPSQSAHTLNVDSLWLDNPTDRDKVVFDRVVKIDAVPWIRLFFDKTNLPIGSRLRLTGERDRVTQRLDAFSIVDYANSSCFFNGGSVRLELVAAPHTKGNRVLIVRAETGLAGIGSPESICGSRDDRKPSADKRQGRLSVGCTGWLFGKDVMATAGHCMGTPSAIMEFNVPWSTSNGTLVRSHPDDQYPTIPNTVKALNGGVGADWSIGRMGRNSNTNKFPGDAQGAWYDLGAVPASTTNQNIRITGYGATTPRNHLYLAQKTHVGPLYTVASTYLRYHTDTTGGNSGSPIIHENTGKVVGIHSHGGCTTSSTSGNHGTRIDRADLQAAIRALTGNPGGSSAFGAGCKGSRGVPAHSLVGTPEIGKTVTFVTNNVPFNVYGLYFFGLSDKQSGALALPFDLTILGMPTCFQLVSTETVVPTNTQPSGFAVLITSIPNNPALIGLTIYSQYAAQDQGSNAGNTIVSNGVKITIGG